MSTLFQVTLQWHVRFTTVPSKSLSDQGLMRSPFSLQSIILNLSVSVKVGMIYSSLFKGCESDIPLSVNSRSPNLHKHINCPFKSQSYSNLNCVRKILNRYRICLFVRKFSLWHKNNNNHLLLLCIPRQRDISNPYRSNGGLPFTIQSAIIVPTPPAEAIPLLRIPAAT